MNYVEQAAALERARVRTYWEGKAGTPQRRIMLLVQWPDECGYTTEGNIAVCKGEEATDENQGRLERLIALAILNAEKRQEASRGE